MAKTTPSTAGTTPLPLAFELIDLDAHPDGELLRLIAEASELMDELEDSRGRKRGSFAICAIRLAPLIAPLHERIVAARPVTYEGWHSKALYALGRDGADHMAQTQGHLHAIAYAVIADALRLRVPA